MFNEHIHALEQTLGLERTMARAIRSAELRMHRREQSASLMAFIRYFWHVVEPTERFVEGWALRAMCAHLEAVDRGEIRKLLMTVPPGSMKSLLCSVFFPLWQWGPRDRAEQRFLNFAYSAHLTERDNNRMLQILRSREWRELWGERREKVWNEDRGRYELVNKGFGLTHAGAQQISTTRTGWKLATSVGGVGTGERGGCVLLDDPHSIKDDTSEVVRPETVRWFKEAMSNRLNNMETSVIIAIMQRSHEADVAGEIIDNAMGYVHLNIPMEYEADQHCVTHYQHGPRAGHILWEDPRKIEGECFWSERFPPASVAEIKKLGDHVWVSQYQQRPEPRGGAIIKRKFWQHYEVPTSGARKGKWPEFEYTLASLDSAFTEKTENDPSGFSIWGVFQNDAGSMCAMLLMAWRKHLTLGGTTYIPPKRKTQSWADYKSDHGEDWGIVQWMRYECTRFKVNQLLIENKANGIDIYNELRKHAAFDPWAMTLIDPKNLDKIARVNRVQPVFADGLVYARTDTAYAKLAIDEAAAFPRGRFRDITDSATQALWYLRKNGYLEHVDVFRARDVRAKERAGKKVRGKKALYEV
jgi:hypothetical protein